MKLGSLEPRRSEDIKIIVALERGPKSFETFEKQAPRATCWIMKYFRFQEIHLDIQQLSHWDKSDDVDQSWTYISSTY